MSRKPIRFARYAGILLVGFALLGFAAPLTPISPTPAAAQARTEISVEFRTALEPYGTWRQHARWGEVWVPNDRPGDWQPFTVGHWVYSNDYGWYWIAAAEEEPWGSIVFHYGRWVLDSELGWIWVPAKEWGPGWVMWRHGKRAAGWAPLPPDEIRVTVRNEPRYWIFVRPRDLVVADMIVKVRLPPEPVYLRETVIVNETIIVRERGFAVNPGIPPQYIAADYGRPIPAYEVRPVVLAGTSAPPNAVQIRAEEIRSHDNRAAFHAAEIQRSQTVIHPGKNLPPPQPLAATEPGRLGPTPPRAAQGAATSGAATPQNKPGAPGREAPATQGAAPNPNAPAATQGAASPNAAPNRLREQRQQGAAPHPGQRGAGQNLPQAPGVTGKPETTGAAPNLKGAPQPSAKGATPQPPRERNARPGGEERKGQPETSGAAPSSPAPRVERGGPPKVNAPEAPRTQAPVREAPAAQAPKREAPPAAQAPRAPETTGAAPRRPEPNVERPAPAPKVNVPEAPRTQAPAREAPAAQAPKREAPPAAAQAPRRPETTGAAPRGGPPAAGGESRGLPGGFGGKRD